MGLLDRALRGKADAPSPAKRAVPAFPSSGAGLLKRATQERSRATPARSGLLDRADRLLAGADGGKKKLLRMICR